MKNVIMKQERISKKTLIALIVISLLLAMCFSVVSFATTENTMACAEAYEGESKSVESTAILNSLDGHSDFLLVNYKQGYAVFFRETGELLEYSLDDTSAYKGALGNLVYAGPGNYFAKTGEVFISLLDNSPVSISNVGKAATDIRSNFTDKADSALRSKVQYNDELEQLHRGVDNNTNSDTNINSVSVISLSQPAPTQPPASGRFAGAKYIQNADFFIRNPNHAVNNPSVHPQIPSIGACGVVAAQLMLNYHSYYTDRRIIPTTGNGVTFRATNYGSLEFWPDFQIAAGNDNALCTNIGTTDDFFLNLLTRGGGAGMQDWDSIERKMDQFLNEHYTGSATTTMNFWDPIGTRSRAKDEIDADRPIILFMEPIASGWGMHIVLAFGYHNLNDTNGFIVHFGHTTSNHHVWTNQSWYNGSIRMGVNHTHTFVDNGNTLNFAGISQNTHREARCTECDARRPVDLYNTTNIGSNEIRIDSVASISGTQIQLTGNVTLPNTLKGRTVTQIGNSAFANQTQLTHISIPASVTRIGIEAFNPATVLASFTGNRANIDLVIAAGTMTAYLNNGWTGFNVVEFSATGALTVVSGQLRGSVEIPSIFNNRIITSLGNSAFANQTQISQITIPASVTSIGDSAFMNCTNLQTVSLVSGLNLTNTPNHTTSYTNYYYTERSLDINLVAGTTYTLSFDYSNLSATTDLTNVFTSLGVGNTTFAVDLPVQKPFSSSSSGSQVITFTPTAAQLATSSKLWCRFIRTSTPQSVSVQISNVKLQRGVTNIAVNSFTGCTKLATPGLS